MTQNNKDIMQKKKIESAESAEVSEKKKKFPNKRVVYIEIDEEVTTIYDRIKHLKVKNVYLVVPKRAVLFQSIVNLKILKRKAEDIEKNIYIITNDQNGIHLASKIGLAVYDKVEGQEHPSLVSGKFLDDAAGLTPLKASVNTVEEEAPLRRDEKKFSITDLLKKNRKKLFAKTPANNVAPVPQQKKKNKEEKGKLVLIAPNRQALVMLFAVSIMILLIITYIALPGATITLTPRANVLSTSVNVTLADYERNKAELDTHPINEIPSYVVTKKIQKVLTYSTTGKEFHGSNSQGTITITNTSNNDWPLLAKTRFQTGDGLIFRSQKAVVVPAASDKPGTVDITVEADPVDAFNNVIGSRGNVGPTHFFLPGLSADNQKKLYADNKVAFAGGKTDVTKLVAKEDLDAAKQKMTDDLKSAAMAELQAFVKDKNNAQKINLVLLTGKDAINTADPKITLPSGIEGQKLESFDVQGETVVSGIAYNQDDLMSILTSELSTKKNPQKRLVKVDADSLTYRIFETDKVSSKYKITATIKGLEEYDVTPGRENGDRLIKKIKEHVVGKDIKEAESYIQNLPEVEKVKVSSWPAWAPTLPSIPDNIKIELQREDSITFKASSDTQD